MTYKQVIISVILATTSGAIPSKGEYMHLSAGYTMSAPIHSGYGIESHVVAFSFNDLSSNSLNLIVNAIYRVEGGTKTKYPYGIKSVKVKDINDARMVCENTVRNNWKRFLKFHPRGAAGALTKGSESDKDTHRQVMHDFVIFLADVYCPIKSDIGGNVRWKNNMISILHL